ncbi:hypothetical protein E6O75_ATG04075 [Venturia nashicola]|uniref:Uncharacterized protein n=1 Tax=Venturia nashicola TaxID=86259 RepID=A0A4Z1PMD5_9PEZI|nr:hypothetical protein E6O75_ATG04075 [Venturia nashicola]
MYGWETEHGWNLGAEEAFGYLGDILKQWNPTKWRREGSMWEPRGQTLCSGSSQASRAHLRLLSGACQAPLRLLSGLPSSSQPPLLGPLHFNSSLNITFHHDFVFICLTSPVAPTRCPLYIIASLEQVG